MKKKLDALTKKEIAGDIVTNTGLTPFEAYQGVETFLEIIKETLEKGEEVTLSGFGKWSIRDKRARRSRNPRTGQELSIKPRRSITFSLSKALRSRLGDKV